MDQLLHIAIVDDHFGKPLALDDGEVVLDGNPPRVDLQPVEQGDHREGLLDFKRLTVEGYVHLIRPTIGPTGRGRPSGRPFIFLVSGFGRSLSNAPALVESKDSAIR